MRKTVGLVIASIVLIVSSVSVAEQPSMLLEGGPQVLLFDVTKVTLDVSDQVTDGCLPRPNSVAASAEAALRRNNFSVLEEPSLFEPKVTVTALGYAVKDYSCVVAVSMSISRWVGATVPHSGKLGSDMNRTLVPFEREVYSTILTGPKSNMQDRIEREAEKAANNLFIIIDRARDSVKSKWPQLWEAAHGE